MTIWTEWIQTAENQDQREEYEREEQRQNNY